MRTKDKVAGAARLSCRLTDPGYMSRKFESFERINSIRETNGNVDYATHVSSWYPAVYVSCMRQNYRLFHILNLSVRNFPIFLLMSPGSLRRTAGRAGHGCQVLRRRAALPSGDFNLNYRRRQWQAVGKWLQMTENQRVSDLAPAATKARRAMLQKVADGWYIEFICERFWLCE